MIFLIFITLITGLQVLHRRLLHQLFPPRFDRWVLPFLVAVHVPLALYMAVRLSGGSGAALWLRPWARAGAYFQLLTVTNLLIWAVASLAWKWTHLWRRPAGERAGRRRGAGPGSPRPPGSVRTKGGPKGPPFVHAKALVRVTPCGRCSPAFCHSGPE